MRSSRRFPWAVLLPLAALAAYAVPGAWHREWRLALSDAWRRTGDTVAPLGPGLPEAEPADDPDERLTALLAERARFLDELSELRAIVESYEITRKTWPNLRLVAAALVPSENADPEGGLLDRGAEDGIAPGDAVVLGDALLGVIVRSGPGSSWMRYVAAPGSVIPARAVPPPATASGSAAAPPPRELCLVSGRGRGQADAAFLTFETPADKDWLLVTARTPDFPLPDGILIGTVLERPTATGDSEARGAPVRLAASALRGLRVTVLKGNTGHERVPPGPLG